MKTDGYRCKSQAEFSPGIQSYSLSEARYKHALYGYLTNELNVVVVFFLFLNKESCFAQEHTFLKILQISLLGTHRWRAARAKVKMATTAQKAHGTTSEVLQSSFQCSCGSRYSLINKI